VIEDHPHLTAPQRRELYGWAEMDPPGPVTAGQTGTWRITYHAGRYGVDDGGVIKIAWRDVSDWSKPQFDDPAASSYASVATDGASTLKAQFDRQRYARPWRLCVTIDVFDDSLRQGDTVTLTLGDTSGGGEAGRAQTYSQEAFEFRVAVDWCGTWVYTEVESPVFPVVSGPPERLVVVGPSTAEPGEATWVGIKAEDLWGNPCRQYDGTVSIEADGLEGLPDSYAFTDADRGVRRFDGVRAVSEGACRVRATDDANRLQAEGNPLRCRAGSDRPRPFWGDLHGQSEETVGTNPVSSYFTFARDSALVDFAGHQGNDFQITEAVWSEIKTQANGHNEDGRFTAFVGYEWSGNTPVGGDHNVYYLDDDGPLHRSSHVLIDDKSDIGTDCLHVTDLYAALKGQRALLVPHVGGRYANLDWHNAELEPVIEVYSEWGEFEWFLKWALEQGYRVGFTAGSDDHKGRPGAAWSGSGAFGVYGGLTCVYADELSRQGVWDALRARRCYGTSGARILIDARADGQPMGSAFDASAAPAIDVEVAGTAPIERIDLFRGAEIVHSWPQPIPRHEERVRIAWAGQRIRARNRLARWDGSLTTDRGRFVDVEGYAFDTPSEGLRSVEDRRLTWASVTTGDADGVLFRVADTDDTDDATLRFDTPILDHQIDLAQIRQGPVVVDAGGVDMRVTFEMAPAGSDREAAVRLQDDALVPGTHAYWVRVTQVDGHKAWVSPFYVTVG
jgi:hypothetical protein